MRESQPIRLVLYTKSQPLNGQEARSIESVPSYRWAGEAWKCKAEEGRRLGTALLFFSLTDDTTDIYRSRQYVVWHLSGWWVFLPHLLTLPALP